MTYDAHGAESVEDQSEPLTFGPRNRRADFLISARPRMRKGRFAAPLSVIA